MVVFFEIHLWKNYMPRLVVLIPCGIFLAIGKILVDRKADADEKVMMQCCAHLL